MAKQNMVYFDGMKAINAWDVDSMRGWVSLSGDDDDTLDARDKYYRYVPWLYRGVEDRAANVGNMPFVVRAGGKEVDTSADYQNKLEWLPSPKRLFQKIEKSLTVYGKAYVKLEVNSSGYIKGVKYLKASTVKEIYDKDTGVLTGYERNLGARKVIFKPTEVLAVYLPDHETEVGPGKSSPVTAALVSAGVLHNSDKFVSQFFERGAIKATVLTTAGFNRDEADRLQHWWDDVVAGIKNAWSAIVLRGDAVKPTIIGEGLESLTNEGLTTERRQNIATALGVPESRMWSSAANYATRKEDEKAYFTGTIIPECDLIAEAFNAQVFTVDHKLDGYTLKFTSESLDIFQTEAAEQASAITALTNAGVPLIMALDLTGVDLTPEQRAELEKLDKEREENAAQIQEQMQPTAPPKLDEEEEEEPEPDQVDEEMAKWRRKATRAYHDTGSAYVKFSCDYIPEQTAAIIRDRLEGAKSLEDIKRAFAVRVDPLLILAGEIRAAREALANG